MEDRISKNLTEMNRIRIEAENKANRKFFASKKKGMKLLFGYLRYGDFKYAAFRISGQKNSKGNISNCKRRVDAPKIAVYTVVFGNYDNLHEPMYITPNCDYFVITNQELQYGDVWKPYKLPDRVSEKIKDYSNLEKARYCKLYPHEIFKDYEYSIFIDGNVQLISDARCLIEQLGNNFIASHQQRERDCIYQEATEVKVWNKANANDVDKQVNAYRKEGFPEHFGMFQTNVLVRDHHHHKCQELMECWWEEISKHTKRDQLSFTYALWKCNLSSDDVSVLAASSYNNPRIYVHKHK